MTRENGSHYAYCQVGKQFEVNQNGHTIFINSNLEGNPAFEVEVLPAHEDAKAHLMHLINTCIACNGNTKKCVFYKMKKTDN